MNPIIKWAGGKEKELPYIKENLPSNIKRYVEPFVGGGAVYFNLNVKKSIINDKSEELINLYRCIKNNDKEFFSNLKAIYKNWMLLESVVENNSIELLKIYRDYCTDLNNNSESKNIKTKFNDKIYAFVIKHAEEFNGILSSDFNIDIDNFINEIAKNLISKMNRMFKIEKQRKLMNKKDTLDNIECAFKSAFYMHFRHLYNEAEKLNIDTSFYTAIFYFIREFCYASMFRYNKNGKFNVPYGGISYNRKEFRKKIEYIDSKEIKEYMEQTRIYCDDFEVFLKKVEPEKGDFIFLDPPYDTEFSTYAKNEFAKKDQVRLCEYLKNTKANIMLIIKNTEFIYNLYNTKEFKIKTFDKKYLVSFQNRNDKDVEHLLITNY
jgi:DNA adenine methylase